MNYNPNSTEVKDLLEGVLQRHFGCTAAEASRDQMYKAAAITVKNILSDKRSAYKKKVNAAGAKRVYYMCMEFLLGRSLKTNLCNLGLDNAYRKALKKMGFDLDDLYECEPDAGLGNGGLVFLQLGNLLREVRVSFLHISDAVIQLLLVVINVFFPCLLL